MRLSVKKAMADSVSRWLQKYLDTTNILQYPEEEFARFDFLVCGPYYMAIWLYGYRATYNNRNRNGERNETKRNCELIRGSKHLD